MSLEPSEITGLRIKAAQGMPTLGDLIDAIHADPAMSAVDKLSLLARLQAMTGGFTGSTPISPLLIDLAISFAAPLALEG